MDPKQKKKKVNIRQADEDKIAQENEPMLLSLRDRESFAAAILNPPEPNEQLRAAANRYRERSKNN